MKQAVELSLKRLNIECIDLYYAHRIDPNIPVEDMVGAMAELVKEGKVKYLGLSEASAASIKKPTRYILFQPYRVNILYCRGMLRMK